MIPSTVRIFVCTEPQDMRRGFDGLALVAREQLGEDPRSGALFCFANKRANRLKVLWWDETGFCVLYKRMHQAVVRLPKGDGRSMALKVDARQLQALLAGVRRGERPRKRA
jgi:transposase